MVESLLVGNGLFGCGLKMSILVKLLSLVGFKERPIAELLIQILLLLPLLRSLVGACSPSAGGVGGFLGLSLGALWLAVAHHLHSLPLQLVLLQLKLLLGLLCLIVK